MIYYVDSSRLDYTHRLHRRGRRVAAVAFVPTAEVHHYFKLILDDERARDDGLIVFMEYVQKTYIGYQVTRIQETPARFPYQSWNMYERIKEDLPRTTTT